MDLSKRPASQIEDSEEGPSGVKPKLDHHLRPISDDRYAIEAKQDADSNANCKKFGFPTTLNFLQAGALLTEIIRFSGDKLNHKYMDIGEATTLVQDHPDLFLRLGHAWSSKRYKEIRNMGNRP